MMLDHPEYGPLLRPVGSKLSVLPLEPLCVAASEGNAEEVRRFLQQGLIPNVLDVDGRSPLLLAGEQGHLGCCVLLAGAGADVTVALSGTADRDGRRTTVKQPKAKALLGAFAGRAFDKVDYQEALDSLPSDLQAEAESLTAAATAMTMGAQGVERARQPIVRDLLARTNRDDSAPPAEGEYEVVFASVYIRKEPNNESEKISKRVRGDIVTVVEIDKISGLWGRIEFATTEGRTSGWMLLRHPELGVLLRPVRQGEDTEVTAG